MSQRVLELALDAVACAVGSGSIAPPPTLTVIDYSRPSIEPRLWVFNLSTGALLFKELVAHGKNSGENLTRRFSDELNSLQSSLGLFVTEGSYVGSNGYSLRLNGLEPRFNQRARERAIVMHGAPYVDAQARLRSGPARAQLGLPGASTGDCSAGHRHHPRRQRDLPYYPEADWLNSSRFLGGCRAAT